MSRAASFSLDACPSVPKLALSTTDSLRALVLVERAAKRLRDWVHRYNKEGLGGLVDRARSGRPASLSWAEQGKLSSWVEEGADLARDGVVRFRRADLRDRIAAEFGVTLHERSVGRLLRRLDFRRLSVRPLHPQSDPEAQETFKKTLQP